MAYFAQPIQSVDYSRHFFDLAMDLDRIEWSIENNSAKDGTIDASLHAKLDFDLNNDSKMFSFYCQEIGKQPPQPQHVVYELQHLQTKVNHCFRKLYGVKPVLPALQSSSLLAIMPAPQSSQPTSLEWGAAPSTSSLRVEEIVEKKPFPPLPSASLLLGLISFSLRKGDEEQALLDFDSLSSEMQRGVYDALWLVRGKPIDHDNFGEVSFKNKEPRCASTPVQKACAVDLYKILAPFVHMLQVLGQNDLEGFKRIFNGLSEPMQNQVYFKHWEMMGKPTEQSSDASLKKIAHPDFGKVSILGLEPRCDVAPEKKAATLTAVLNDLKQKINQFQKSINNLQTHWDSIDSNNSIPGQQKNILKKDSLFRLAKTIVPIFTPDVVIAPINPQDSFVACAASYIEKHPCLRPFFLQLVPDLNLKSEETNPSSVATPQFDPHDVEGQKKYRVEIMNQTIATLSDRGYVNAKGERISLHLDTAKDSIAVVKSSEKQLHMRPYKYQTQIHLDKMDCLYVAEVLVNRGLNPIVLNAASDGHFGGGYKTGARAQEEDLCRRSGLSVVALREKEFYGLSKKWGPAAGLYIKDVPVFRAGVDQGYAYKDKPFQCAFAIFSAINNPRLTDGHLVGKEKAETIEKIRTMLHMAELKGHDSIVLMPFGCGAFRNPPVDISLIMMVVIEKEFPNSFKEIRFAVIEDHNSHNASSVGNYIPFKDAIEGHQKSPLVTKHGAKIFVN